MQWYSRAKSIGTGEGNTISSWESRRKKASGSEYEANTMHQFHDDQNLNSFHIT